MSTSEGPVRLSDLEAKLEFQRCHGLDMSRGGHWIYWTEEDLRGEEGHAERWCD